MVRHIITHNITSYHASSCDFSRAWTYTIIANHCHYQHFHNHPRGRKNNRRLLSLWSIPLHSLLVLKQLENNNESDVAAMLTFLKKMCFPVDSFTIQAVQHISFIVCSFHLLLFTFPSSSHCHATTPFPSREFFFVILSDDLWRHVTTCNNKLANRSSLLQMKTFLFYSQYILFYLFIERYKIRFSWPIPVVKS